jgi:thiamine pyrophosphokinase
MTQIMSKVEPILLIGGGIVEAEDFRVADRLCRLVVAADSGADRALDLGHAPDWIIGDFDSLSPRARQAVPVERHLAVAEQETTDFEKALTRIAAPAVLCLGFTGARIDHELAAYHTLLRHADRRAVVLGGTDICLHVREAALDLPLGSRLSLFPLAPVTGRSEGLHWPIGGLEFAPGRRIGTSNRVTGPVRLAFDGDGMLLILPKAALPAVLAGWGLPPG